MVLTSLIRSASHCDFKLHTVQRHTHTHLLAILRYLLTNILFAIRMNAPFHIHVVLFVRLYRVTSEHIAYSMHKCTYQAISLWLYPYATARWGQGE